MDIRLRLDRLDVTSNIVAIIKANEDEPVFVRNRGTLQMFTTAGKWLALEIWDLFEVANFIVGSYSAKFITGRAVGEPGSSLSLENICRAADMCREGHEGCRRGLLGSDMETDPELPRRVLDVSSPTEPRLFVTNGARAQFVVLSHRWFGRISQAMTLRSNIQDFRDGIPLASLPKVFRDAITVTRALGFDYLWIDSLCIIQDSQEDWLSEAEAMGSTFEKAFCTISATGAQDVSQGCFIQNTSYEKAVTFIPELEGNKAAPVYFSKQRPGVGAAYFDEGPLVSNETTSPPFKY